MVLVGVVLKGSLGGTTFWWMYKVYSSCGFQQGNNIGNTSSTCRYYTLINFIRCNDSYPISILSLIFLYHPYIPSFLIQRNFYFLVSFLFLLHACMYSHQVYNSNGGLAPKIGFLVMQGWMVSSLYNVLWECIVVAYTQTTLFTNI